MQTGLAAIEHEIYRTLVMRQDGRQVVKHQINLPADKILNRLGATTIWDMRDEGPSQAFEQLATQMPGRTVTRRAHC